MTLFELLFSNIVQATAVISIVVLGIIAYVVAKPNWNTRVLVTVSLLVVLSVVLQRFGIMIPLFGFPSFRIDFLHIPLIMVGALFGPFFGVLAGVVADIVGLIITPTEYPFFGFMLNKVLMGFIPAIMVLVIRRLSLKNGVRLAHLTLLSINAASIIYLWITPSLTISGQVMMLTYQTKLIVVAILLALMISLHGLLVNKSVTKVRVFALLSVIFVELIVSLLLTPIWLVTMYNIPVFLSFIVRVIKAAFMIPISALLLEGLIHSTQKVLHRTIFDSILFPWK
ncbi:MAG: folate family ECF transporter S component [Erysipelothrix sp.]|jgi:ECF transporter S component (folate family)|nr:folate family ECF transporter S component [Erysipelothrix sp.]